MEFKEHTEEYNYILQCCTVIGQLVANLFDRFCSLIGFALACNGFLLCVLHRLPLYKKCIENWLDNK